jgi:phosphate transport system protein
MLANFNEDMSKITEELKVIGDNLIKANELLLEGMANCDAEIFGQAKAKLNNVGKKTNDIDNNIVKVLALYSPEATDLRRVIAYFKISNELLRASSNTRSFIKGFLGICEFVDIETINQYAIPMQSSTVKAVKLATSMIDMDCEDEIKDTYNEVFVEENKNNDLYEMVETNLYKQANQSAESEDFEKFHNMLKALRKSEKIADRATSIASLFLYTKVGGNI